MSDAHEDTQTLAPPHADQGIQTHTMVRASSDPTSDLHPAAASSSPTPGASSTCLPRISLDPSVPLLNTWSFYFDDGNFHHRPSTSSSSSSSASVSTPSSEFLKHLVHLGSFNSIQDFWNYFNSVDLNIHKICRHGRFNLRLFKQGIQPIFDQPSQEKGGKWVFKSTPSSDLKKTRDIWFEALMAVVGEQLPLNHTISGCVLSCKPHRNEVQLWVSSPPYGSDEDSSVPLPKEGATPEEIAAAAASTQQLALINQQAHDLKLKSIAHSMRRLLRLDETVRMSYIPHSYEVEKARASEADHIAREKEREERRKLKAVKYKTHKSQTWPIRPPEEFMNPNSSSKDNKEKEKEADTPSTEKSAVEREKYNSQSAEKSKKERFKYTSSTASAGAQPDQSTPSLEARLLAAMSLSANPLHDEPLPPSDESAHLFSQPLTPPRSSSSIDKQHRLPHSPNDGSSLHTPSNLSSAMSSAPSSAGSTGGSATPSSQPPQQLQPPHHQHQQSSQRTSPGSTSGTSDFQRFLVSKDSSANVSPSASSVARDLKEASLQHSSAHSHSTGNISGGSHGNQMLNGPLASLLGLSPSGRTTSVPTPPSSHHHQQQSHHSQPPSHSHTHPGLISPVSAPPLISPAGVQSLLPNPAIPHSGGRVNTPTQQSVSQPLLQLPPGYQQHVSPRQHSASLFAPSGGSSSRLSGREMLNLPATGHMSRAERKQALKWMERVHSKQEQAKSWPRALLPTPVLPEDAKRKDSHHTSSRHHQSNQPVSLLSHQGHTVSNNPPLLQNSGGTPSSVQNNAAYNAYPTVSPSGNASAALMSGGGILSGIPPAVPAPLSRSNSNSGISLGSSNSDLVRARTEAQSKSRQGSLSKPAGVGLRTTSENAAVNNGAQSIVAPVAQFPAALINNNAAAAAAAAAPCPQPSTSPPLPQHLADLPSPTATQVYSAGVLPALELTESVSRPIPSPSRPRSRSLFYNGSPCISPFDKNIVSPLLTAFKELSMSVPLGHHPNQHVLPAAALTHSAPSVLDGTTETTIMIARKPKPAVSQNVFNIDHDVNAEQAPVTPSKESQLAANTDSPPPLHLPSPAMPSPTANSVVDVSSLVAAATSSSPSSAPSSAEVTAASSVSASPQQQNGEGGAVGIVAVPPHKRIFTQHGRAESTVEEIARNLRIKVSAAAEGGNPTSTALQEEDMSTTMIEEGDKESSPVEPTGPPIVPSPEVVSTLMSPVGSDISISGEAHFASPPTSVLPSPSTESSGLEWEKKARLEYGLPPIPPTGSFKPMSRAERKQALAMLSKVSSKRKQAQSWPRSMLIAQPTTGPASPGMVTPGGSSMIPATLSPVSMSPTNEGGTPVESPRKVSPTKAGLTVDVKASSNANQLPSPSISTRAVNPFSPNPTGSYMIPPMGGLPLTLPLHRSLSAGEQNHASGTSTPSGMLTPGGRNVTLGVGLRSRNKTALGATATPVTPSALPPMTPPPVRSALNTAGRLTPTHQFPEKSASPAPSGSPSPLMSATRQSANAASTPKGAATGGGFFGSNSSIPSTVLLRKSSAGAYSPSVIPSTPSALVNNANAHSGNHSSPKQAQGTASTAATPAAAVASPTASSDGTPSPSPSQLQTNGEPNTSPNSAVSASPMNFPGTPATPNQAYPPSYSPHAGSMMDNPNKPLYIIIGLLTLLLIVMTMLLLKTREESQLNAQLELLLRHGHVAGGQQQQFQQPALPQLPR